MSDIDATPTKRGPPFKADRSQVKHSYSVRLTPGHYARLRELGGGKWLAKMIDATGETK